MKTTIILTLVLASFVTLPAQDANVIIDQYLNQNRVENLTGNISYKNISKSGRVQERTLEQYVKRHGGEEDEYSFLLKFTAPVDVIGTATLTVQDNEDRDDQWLYLPVVRSARKISPSKKSDRFMGTEMTYEDLSLYLSEKKDQWDYVYMQGEMQQNIDCHKIVALPKANTETQYSKRILWIDKERLVLMKAEFYGKSKKLIKLYESSEVKLIGGSQYRAHRILLSNMVTGNRTEVEYSDFNISKSLSSAMFTKAQLESL